MKRKLSQRDGSGLKFWRSLSSQIIENCKNRKIFANLGDTSTILTPSEIIRVVSEGTTENATRNLLLKCMLDAENKSVGGAYILLCALSGMEMPAESAGRRFTLNDLKSSLNFFIDEQASDIVSEAVSIAGRKGKIFIDGSISQCTEISYGTQVCKWKPNVSFFNSVLLPKVSVQNCKVIFIDGIIESVSEAHKIFQDSYEKKISVVIFARGYAEEFIATAAINFQRQTAQILPIAVPFDEVGVNGLADIAMCFSSDVISSDKGQLISNINIDDHPVADRITSSAVATEIEFKNNQVNTIVSRLSERLRTTDANQSELIRKRIEALGTGSVSIKIGSDKKSLSGIIKDRVDFGVRFSKSCISSGVIDFGDIAYPIQSIKSGTDCAKSFISILNNCGCILEVDKCG